MEWLHGQYRISTDPSRLSLAAIHEFLKQSYWANTRPVEKIEKSLPNSICYGVYREDEQVGFARVVTDYATFYWLADVFIRADCRGLGLGKWLISCVVNTPELQDLRGVLATRDAHGLYEQFGFQVPEDPRRYMFRPADTPPAAYEPGEEGLL